MICLICSAARSGSTLLDVVRGGHAEGASLGEFSFLGKAIALDQTCSCGAPLSSCESWAEVFEEVVRERGIDLRTTPYALHQWDALARVVIDHAHQTRKYLAQTKVHTALCDIRYTFAHGHPLRLPLTRSLRDGIENSFYLYKILKRVWNNRFLVDSSKNVHKAIALYERDPSQVRVVYLTRDGRAVLHSRQTSGFSTRDSVRAWYRYNRRARNLLWRNIPGEHLFRLRYEDLMADPPGAMRRLCEFLKVDYADSAPEVKPNAQHLINGNDMRLKGQQELSLDERWRTGLSLHNRAYFDHYAGKLNAQLGYVD